MPASVFRWEETKGGRSGLLKSCLRETPVYELDCGGFAPNFFPFLFKKQFSSNLVQTFKSSVDVVERTFTLLHCGETFQSRRTCPSCWDARLQITFMDKRAVHMQQMCACAHICVYVFVPSSVLCTSVSMFRTSRSWKKEPFLLYDSAENTMCRL